MLPPLPVALRPLNTGDEEGEEESWENDVLLPLWEDSRGERDFAVGPRGEVVTAVAEVGAAVAAAYSLEGTLLAAV